MCHQPSAISQQLSMDGGRCGAALLPREVSVTTVNNLAVFQTVSRVSRAFRAAYPYHTLI